MAKAAKAAEAEKKEKTRDDGLESVLAGLRKQFGEGAIVRLGETSVERDDRAISTGAFSLDIALGIGGLPRGRVVEIYGPESSGKTTLVMHIVANAQKDGGTAALIDAEHAMDPGYCAKIGVNLDDLLVSQPSSGEEALTIAETLIRSDAIDVVVIDSVAALVATGRFAEAERLCRERPSFLGTVMAEGLVEAPLGYPAVEKSMEDASAEQAARLFRKIEYLSVIGTIAPMLGLLGTVWGMIVAFQEFATKLNPPVSELAPGIYQALVTTLMGLGVAVPALTAFAIFRNRIDELVAEASLRAEHAWAGFKRASLGRGGRKSVAGDDSGRRERRVPPVAIERPERPERPERQAEDCQNGRSACRPQGSG